MCNFDKNGTCQAMACFSSEECGSRDKNGNPNYCDKCEKCGKYICRCNDK